ncbi:MAG: NAD(P)-dependent oxidoreductase [Pirellulaceae bacterium]
MDFSDTNSRIGWVGAGVMGRSMVGHLLKAGYTINLFSRTKAKVEDLIADSAIQWCDSPASVAAQSDVVFSIVGYPADVNETHLGPRGTIAGGHPGLILVDMTTSSPALAQEIYSTAVKRKMHSVDAPVSGGDIGAKNATLSIMIGGDEPIVTAISPLLKHLGKTIVHQGPAGSGQHTKMVNQTLIATNMIGVCEALLYAHKAELNLETVMESVASGAAGSWSLSNLGPRIIKGNFDPGFYVEHFVKDMGIALDEANRMGLALPGLALAKQLYVALQAQGGSKLGTQALHLALARLSGIDWQATE